MIKYLRLLKIVLFSGIFSSAAFTTTQAVASVVEKHEQPSSQQPRPPTKNNSEKSKDTNAGGSTHKSVHRSGDLPNNETEEPEQRVSQLYLETDPTVYFFRGFSFAVRRSAFLLNNFIIGVGLYRSVLPDFYIGKEWRAKNLGGDLFMDYHFFHPNRGLSLGLILSLYRYTIKRDSRTEHFLSLVETLRIGYLWRPFRKLNFESFYLFPWIGLSTDQKVSGKNTINGNTFKTPKISVVPAIQIGFSF